jgi:hypothetical protein
MPNYMMAETAAIPTPSRWARVYGRKKGKRVKHRIGARCVYTAKPELDRFTNESTGGYPARSGMPCVVAGGENRPRDYVVEFGDGFRGLVFGEELGPCE